MKRLLCLIALFFLTSCAALIDHPPTIEGHKYVENGRTNLEVEFPSEIYYLDSRRYLKKDFNVLEHKLNTNDSNKIIFVKIITIFNGDGSLFLNGITKSGEALFFEDFPRGTLSIFAKPSKNSMFIFSRISKLLSKSKGIEIVIRKKVENFSSEKYWEGKNYSFIDELIKESREIYTQLSKEEKKLTK